MKKLFQVLILGLLLTSCDKEDTITPEQDLSTSLNLKITKLNSPDTNTYSIHLKDVTKKYSGWSDYTKWTDNSTENISIVKSITFNTQLPTEEKLEIEVWLHKLESEKLLKLNDEITQIDHWQIYKEWDYISYDKKITNFYNNQIDRRLIINGSNVMFGKEASFDIVNTSEVRINGESKTRVRIKFQGELYPFYSSYTPADAQYRVEGEFNGIIE
jgi:hypothetical protein